MINFIGYSDKAFETRFTPVIEEAYQDVSFLLNAVPSTMRIKFTRDGAESSSGVGGFAESPHQINLAVSKEFEDFEMQKTNLRGVVFHESFHIQQGFTFHQAPFTALEAALYEGCAVVFEQRYTSSLAHYADYQAHSNSELEKWREDLKEVGIRYFEDGDTWRRWAFYHPEYDQKWIVYKVGSWLIDRILVERKLDILDLQNKSADEIDKML